MPDTTNTPVITVPDDQFVPNSSILNGLLTVLYSTMHDCYHWVYMCTTIEIIAPSTSLWVVGLQVQQSTYDSTLNCTGWWQAKKRQAFFKRGQSNTI